MNYKHHTYAKKAMIARVLEAGRKRLKVFNPRTLENFLTREMSLSWEKWRVKSTKIGKEYDFYFVQAPTNDLRWKKVGGFYEVEALGWVGGQVKALETSPNKMDRFLGELVKLKPDMQKTDFSIKGGTYLSNPAPISLFILSWRDGHAEEIIDIDLELKIREDRLTNLLIKKMFEVGGFAQALPLDVPPPVIVDVDKEVVVEEVKPSDLVDESSRVYQGLILKEEDMDGARFGYDSTHDHLRRRLLGMDKKEATRKYNAIMNEAYRKFVPLLESKTEESIIQSDNEQLYQAYGYLIDIFRTQLGRSRKSFSQLKPLVDQQSAPFKIRFERPLFGKSTTEAPITEAEKVILDRLEPATKMRLLQQANYFYIVGDSIHRVPFFKLVDFDSHLKEYADLILKIRNHPNKPGRLPAYQPPRDTVKGWYEEFFSFIHRNPGQKDAYIEILEDVGFVELFHKSSKEGGFRFNSDFTPPQSIDEVLGFYNSQPWGVAIEKRTLDKKSLEYIKPPSNNPQLALLDGQTLDDFPIPQNIFDEYKKLGVDLHLVKSDQDLEDTYRNLFFGGLPQVTDRARELWKSNEGTKIKKLLTAGLFALQICKQYPSFNLKKIIWVLQRGRAHARNNYRNQSATLQVGYDCDTDVAIHEVMHSLEYYCPEIRDYGTAFYCNQVNDPKKTVRACSASGEYSLDMKNPPSNYAGKLYPGDTASEIVTTTMEAFKSKEALASLAKKNPEYFLFAYNIRNGLVK